MLKNIVFSVALAHNERTGQHTEGPADSKAEEIDGPEILEKFVKKLDQLNAKTQRHKDNSSI